MWQTPRIKIIVLAILLYTPCIYGLQCTFDGDGQVAVITAVNKTNIDFTVATYDNPSYNCMVGDNNFLQANNQYSNNVAVPANSSNTTFCMQAKATDVICRHQTSAGSIWLTLPNDWWGSISFTESNQQWNFSPPFYSQQGNGGKVFCLEPSSCSSSSGITNTSVGVNCYTLTIFWGPTSGNPCSTTQTKTPVMPKEKKK